MRDRYASLREGLVGAWIPSVSGSGLLLPDFSGNGNNGTLTNMGPEDWVSGQYGRALDFDGSNDYVSLGNTITLSADFSVFWWQKKTSGTTKIIFADVSANYIATFQGNSATTMNARLAAVNHFDTTVNPQITGEWQHLGFVRRGAFGQFWTSSIPSSGLSVTTASTTWTTLAARGGGTFPLDGQLDDIRIYNRALSESEIKLLASRPGIGLRPQRRSMYYAPPTGARRRRILTSMP